MPQIDENLAVWSRSWDWSQQGDEWSEWWGGTDALWHGALLPRIHAFVPTGTILEIAPGYGRWTQYLLHLAERLVIVDLTSECIEHCRRRFADRTNIEYHVNDGRSLAMVPDGSIDFAFSFDSLVHAESDVIGEYLRQLARKLKPDGVGFVHHSNMGAYRHLAALARRAPTKHLHRLVRAGVLANLLAWRAESVTAESFAQQCADAGLCCMSQEQISWQCGRYMIDTISMFTPEGSRYARPRQVLRNPLFVSEGRRMARLYASTSFANAAGPPLSATPRETSQAL